MTNLPVLAILIPMVTAIMLMFTKNKPDFQKDFSLMMALVMLVYSLYLLVTVKEHGILVFYSGGWQAPFGISLVVDLFSAIMLLLSSILSFAGILFSFVTIEEEKVKSYYFAIWQFLIMGINGTFITGDMLNLFVFFEILLMASYALLSIGGTKAQLRETFKYLIINILSSTVFLIALGSLYALIGSTNMADIAQKTALVENQGLITVVSMVFLVVFGVKAAVFPLYFWLPKVHTVAASAVSCIFSGLLIKVGVYALVRMFTLIFIGEPAVTHRLLIILAIVSMFFGAVGAVSEMNYKGILAYHSVSQIGYIIMGLGLFTVTGLAGSIYFTVHHGIVKGCLFLTAGVTEKLTGTKDLKKMGGLMSRYPALSWAFFIAALSLAGVPPLSGFFGKFTLVYAAAKTADYWAMGLAVACGILTLFSMIKIFLYVFWGEAKREYTPKPGFQYGKAMFPCFLLVVMTLAMGILAEPILALCTEAGEQLMNPQFYIRNVLPEAALLT